MKVDEAILKLRSDPKFEQLLTDNYLREDNLAEAKRFSASPEFYEVVRLLGGVRGKTVLDMGAGTGIGTYAFCQHGAAKVFALEPDESAIVGRGAIRRVIEGLPVEVVDGVGENLPFADNTMDVVYCRAVLHHVQDLSAVLREVYRVLKVGGRALLSREHVADDKASLEVFWANHPVHQLAGGEYAYPAEVYEKAVIDGGFKKYKVLKPFDSVIGMSPPPKSMVEFRMATKEALRMKFGVLGEVLSLVPGVDSIVRKRLNSRKHAGRLYTFWGERID